MRTVVQISGRDGDCALSVDCAADDAQKRIVSVLAYKPNGTMALIALIGAAFSGCIRDAASGYRADCKEWGDYAISLRPYGHSGDNGTIECWRVSEYNELELFDDSVDEMASYRKCGFNEFATCEL